MIRRRILLRVRILLRAAREDSVMVPIQGAVDEEEEWQGGRDILVPYHL